MSTLYHGDCLAEMGKIEPASVDLICADLPYGTTACKWDTVIPFEPLWKHFKWVLKPRGAVVLFGSQPFTSVAVTSNLEWFKWEDIWHKVQARGHLNCKVMPLRQHENLLVFCEGKVMYNPQLHDKPAEWIRKDGGRTKLTDCYGKHGLGKHRTIPTDKGYPRSIVKISNANGAKQTKHPTEKPVALLEYLIRTYTNPGDLVLDPVMGSGTCGVATVNLDRHFIGIEQDANYFTIASDRIAKAEQAARQLELI